MQDKVQTTLLQEFGGINKKIFVFYIFKKEGLISLFFFYFYFMKALLVTFLLFFNYSFSQETVFELLNSNQTGVEFNNVVEDKKEHNILLYANYYGGAGVGIADFDNDGFQHLLLRNN